MAPNLELEERLTAALARAADSVQPDPDAWSRVAAATRRADRLAGLRTGLALAAAGIVSVVVVTSLVVPPGTIELGPAQVPPSSEPEADVPSAPPTGPDPGPSRHIDVSMTRAAMLLVAIDGRVDAVGPEGEPLASTPVCTEEPCAGAAVVGGDAQAVSQRGDDLTAMAAVVVDEPCPVVRVMSVTADHRMGTTAIEERGCASAPAFARDGRHLVWIQSGPEVPGLFLLAAEVTPTEDGAPQARVVGRWPIAGETVPRADDVSVTGWELTGSDSGHVRVRGVVDERHQTGRIGLSRDEQGAPIAGRGDLELVWDDVAPTGSQDLPEPSRVVVGVPEPASWSSRSADPIELVIETGRNAVEASLAIRDDERTGFTVLSGLGGDPATWWLRTGGGTIAYGAGGRAWLVEISRFDPQVTVHLSDPQPLEADLVLPVAAPSGTDDRVPSDD